MKFTQAHINALRKEYAKLERVDPAGDGYKGLAVFLDNLPMPMLKQLAEANINFLSLLALNRVMKFKMISHKEIFQAGWLLDKMDAQDVSHYSKGNLRLLVGKDFYIIFSIGNERRIESPVRDITLDLLKKYEQELA